jgi:hypothetical protein
LAFHLRQDLLAVGVSRVEQVVIGTGFSTVNGPR